MKGRAWPHGPSPTAPHLRLAAETDAQGADQRALARACRFGGNKPCCGPAQHSSRIPTSRSPSWVPCTSMCTQPQGLATLHGLHPRHETRPARKAAGAATAAIPLGPKTRFRQGPGLNTACLYVCKVEHVRGGEKMAGRHATAGLRLGRGTPPLAALPPRVTNHALTIKLQSSSFSTAPRENALRGRHTHGGRGERALAQGHAGVEPFPTLRSAGGQPTSQAGMTPAPWLFPGVACTGQAVRKGCTAPRVVSDPAPGPRDRHAVPAGLSRHGLHAAGATTVDHRLRPFSLQSPPRHAISSPPAFVSLLNSTARARWVPVEAGQSRLGCGGPLDQSRFRKIKGFLVLDHIGRHRPGPCTRPSMSTRCRNACTSNRHFTGFEFYRGDCDEWASIYVR